MTASVDAVVSELSAMLGGDGLGLRVVSVDPGGRDVQLAVVLDGVECSDCVLPPDALRAVITSTFAERLGPDVAVSVTDQREESAPAGTGWTLVVDPTGHVEDIAVDRGPDVPSVEGKKVGFRVDVLWPSWDLVSDGWRAALERAGATTDAFRHTQGMPGEEGVKQEAAYDAFWAGKDLAIVGLGNCGSCTSWTIKNAITAAEHGVPTIAVVTAQFEALGRTLARQYGRPGLRFVVLPYPLEPLPEEEIRAISTEMLGRLAEEIGLDEANRARLLQLEAQPA